jgi:IS30 family transposase
LENKPSPKLDVPELTREIMTLFKQVLSADQISGRLGVVYPGQKGKQASPSAIYTYIYWETERDPEMKEHFRQRPAKPRCRKGQKTVVGRYPAVF